MKRVYQEDTLMRSMIQESLNDMRASTARLAEIEALRYRMKMLDVAPEEMKIIDEALANQLREIRLHRRLFWINCFVVFSVIAAGIMNGVLSMSLFREGKIIGGVISGLIAVCLLYLGKKEMFE
jgi:lipopolysaccharide export LptBFGC system permease protein LptF